MKTEFVELFQIKHKAIHSRVKPRQNWKSSSAPAEQSLSSFSTAPACSLRLNLNCFYGFDTTVMQTLVITNSPVDVSLVDVTTSVIDVLVVDVTASEIVVPSWKILVVVSNGSESRSCSAVVISSDCSVVLSVKIHDKNASTQLFSL